jgi:capsular exopolysaccharide synthesis family protein
MSQYDGGRGEQGSSLPLRAYIAAFSRHRWLIAAVVALTVGSALALTFRKPTTYTSEVKLTVEPITLSLDGDEGDNVNMATELEWATSERVAVLAAEELGGDVTPAKLMRVEVKNPEGTEVLSFKYTSAKAEAPQQRVAAIADAYLQFRRERALDEISALSDGLSKRASVVEADLRELNERLATASVTQAASLQIEADVMSGQLALLRQQLASLSSPDLLRVGSIMEEAGVPQPSVPNPVTTGVLAAIVGLALGIGIALLRDHLSERPETPAEFELYGGAPVLGQLPVVRSWRRGKDPYLVTKLEPASSSSEAYRALRTSVLFAAAQKPFKTLLITSANPEEGKTAVTSNLASALAEAGKKVVVVGGDLRRPRIHEFFRVHNGLGLTSVLAGKAKLESAIASERYPGLRVLPAGPAAPNPVELLGSPKMQEVLTALEKEADFVLIDGAPLLPIADAHVLVPYVDAVLYVVDAHKASRPMLERGRTRLEQLGAPVIGIVANRFEQSKGGSETYGHYGYAYATDRRPELSESEDAPAAR